jgi:predicted RNA-binding protein with PIN domain
VMHAGGRLGPKLGREAFRRARRRFLDDLANVFGVEGAGRTTIVFDASVHPGDFQLDTKYRGLAVVFALGDENADARIEQLIAGHPSPKTLTVVSSDRRIRQAAARRRSRCLTAEQYWELIDDVKERKRVAPPAKASSVADTAAEEEQKAAAESALWLAAFRDIAMVPGVKESLAPDDSLLTDADIAKIEREIDREERGRSAAPGPVE